MKVELMSTIELLSDSIINKIAAGEVVERPASVVKELVENALDAEAKNIEIDLEEGGKKRIQVRDDGRGISPHELRLAVSRHATSKIKTVDDLFRIRTLGFRGEALASIASVSKMTLTSRSALSQGAAREIYIEGGDIVEEKEAGHPLGTTVSVKYLFYHTPARLKFLKSEETEVTHILDHVTRMALAYPQVTFRVTHNGKRIISAQGTGNFKRRIADLFGSDISESCYPIIFKEGNDSSSPKLEILQNQKPLCVTGEIGHPQISRSHQRNIYLFVNQRPVKDKVIFHALLEAYRNLLMHGRYPFSILFLEVPEEMVDVNVHPAKLEVRFTNSQQIHRLVYDAVRRTLEREPWGIKIAHESVGASRPGGTPMGLINQAPTIIEDLPIRIIDEKRKIDINRTSYSDLKVIGQLLGTYLVCEASEKMVLIDQHAAHERIGFEKLLLQYQKGSIPVQQLLIPENFDLKPSDTEILKKYVEELEKFGIEIDFFGGGTFVVKAIPFLFQKKVSIRDLILDLIGDILEKGKLTSLTDSLNDILARFACHGAIRAHDLLTLEEMRSLLKELDHYQFTSFCPHGRPVLIEVQKSELERWFKRIV